MTIWTKEQLQSLARVSSAARKKEDIADDLAPEDISPSKRKINQRAVPKIIFSAVILMPVFGTAYLLSSSNLKHFSKEVEAAETDERTKQLLAEREVSNARIEQLEAKLAVIKQEQSHPVTEVEEVPATTAEVTKPIASKPVAQPPPPKQTVRRRVVPPQRTPPPKRTVASSPQPPTIPVTVASSVFGAASSEDVQPQKTEVAQVTPAQPNSEVTKAVSYAPTPPPQRVTSFQLANNFPTINPELETSLLQEQPMVVLRTGASTKANLAVPWLQDLGGRRAESAIISVILTEPLRGAGRRIYLPAQTTVFVKAEYLGQPDIIEFVGVEAQLPTSADGSSRKITLPEGVIRFSAENGQPLVALPVRNKSKSQVRDFFEILDSAEGVWRISNQIGLGDSDDVVGEVLRGQRQIRSRVRQRDRYPSYQSRSQQLVYLPEGTKLKLYVNKEVTVPSVSY